MKRIIILSFLIGLTSQIGICQTVGKMMSITTSSDKARELYIQARDRIQNGELAPGEKLLREAIALDPDFALAQAGLNTRESIKKALELVRYITPGEAYMVRILDASLIFDWKMAALYADSLAALYPKDKHVLYDAGNTFYQTDPEKGVKYLDKAIAADQNFAPPYNIKGYYYMEAGLFDEAGKAFRKYLELKPKSGNAHDSYADFLTKTGKHAQAIEEYRKAYEFEPSLTNSLVKAGWVHIRDGEFSQARKIFAEYNHIAPNDEERLFAILLQAFSSFAEQNMKQAFSDLDAMKMKATEVKNPLYILSESMYKGLMLVEDGKPAKAIPYFNKIRDLIPTMELDPAFVSASNMYYNGYLSMALGLSGKLEEAQKALASAKQIYDSRENTGQDTNFMNLFQGIMEINRKNYTKAVEYMEPRAISAGSVSNQYYTGLAYDRAGNVEKAIEYYTKANESLNTTFPAFYLNKTKKRLEELKKLK